MPQVSIARLFEETRDKLQLTWIAGRDGGAKGIDSVIVATDDVRIAEAAKDFCRVEMTSPAHASGTDRIAEVAARYRCDAAINIQGDEPLIEPDVIDAVAEALRGAAMSTAATALRVMDKTSARGRRLDFIFMGLPAFDCRE